MMDQETRRLSPFGPCLINGGPEETLIKLEQFRSMPGIDTYLHGMKIGPNG